MMKKTRRSFLKTALATTAATALPGSMFLRASSVSAAEPVKVGILHSLTGTVAIAEAHVVDAEKLAIEEINAAGGVNGRELQAVAYDPASDTLAFSRYAKRLMVEDGVTTIFGCYTSSSRKAVAPVVERLNGILWYPTLYEGFEYSPNIIYTGSAPNQNCVELCRFLMDTYGNRFYLIGSDYIYPRELNRMMRDFLVASGGVVVGERYLDLRAKRGEFAPAIRDVVEAGADVIFSTVVGTATSYLYQAYADAGLSPKSVPIASLTTTEAEVLAMGFDVGEGITAASYFEGVETGADASFADRYKRRFGADEPTNACSEAAYFQVFMFAEALRQADTMDTETLLRIVLGSSFEAPQGRVRINPATNHTDLWTRIGRANRRGHFDLIRQSVGPVQADPFLICASRAEHSDFAR